MKRKKERRMKMEIFTYMITGIAIVLFILKVVVR
jgi:hypothetical protein